MLKMLQHPPTHNTTLLYLCTTTTTTTTHELAFLSHEIHKIMPILKFFLSRLPPSHIVQRAGTLFPFTFS